MTQIEQKLGVKFNDQSLIKRALTHSSFSHNNYERLEFLGDSILDFLVGEYLFKNSDKDEGYLTVQRSHFVSENYLAEVFDKLELFSEVVLGKSMGKTLSKAVKADIIEAIIAAIYLDSSIDEARKFIERNFDLDKFESVEDNNYKSRLQEMVQAGFKCAMRYETVKIEDGFEASFYMDEDKITSAIGHDKQSAEQECAKLAIEKLFKV